VLTEHHQLGGFIVDCVNMFLQLGVVKETFLTDITSERVNIGVFQLMFGELQLSFEPLETYFANMTLQF